MNPIYIAAGIEIPMTASARINSRRTTAIVASKKSFSALIGLSKDRVTVIEGIEQLRQLEHVLR